ncbi:MAG TPA: dihydrofolate reductase family protein [Cellulomonadaceae bacterium]|nr:dihydrofolate reductase family protein [Cellulomonadaceae bacterium]
MTDDPTLDVLLPVRRAGTRIPPSSDEHELIALYAHPAPEHRSSAVRPGVHLRANMVSTLDGAATGADRVSGSINNAADHRVFDVLRAVADVVLIGAGTARAEGYADVRVPEALLAGRRARGQSDTLELAVVSATGPLPDDLLDSDPPPLVLTTAVRPDLAALQRRIGTERVLVVGDGASVDVARALDVLAARGLRRVLTEGGPHLVGELARAGLLDELCLTWSPLVVAGPAPRIIDAVGWLAPAVTARPVHLLHSAGVLLGRWVLDPTAAPASWSTGTLPG